MYLHTFMEVGTRPNLDGNIAPDEQFLTWNRGMYDVRAPRTSRSITAPDTLSRKNLLPWLRGGAACLKIIILVMGLLALITLSAQTMQRPVMCVIQVEGRSMVPTLRDRQQAVFARIPWRVGSVVLADVAEDEPIIKRVAAKTSDGVLLMGDNQWVSKNYLVSPDDILAVLVCHMPFSTPQIFLQHRLWPEFSTPIRRNPSSLQTRAPSSPEH
ncbi:MAG: S24/S26 family peptidase [Armatimonadota bacterium]